MSPSDDRSQDPWTDPQTHLDTDPVNAEQVNADPVNGEPAPGEPGTDADPDADPASGTEDRS